MEDAARFDAWATFRKGNREAIASILSQYHPHADRQWLLRSCMRGEKGELVLVARMLGANELDELCERLVPVADSLIRLDAYGDPAGRDQMAHCARHELYYGGLWGCPICEGNAAQRERSDVLD